MPPCTALTLALALLAPAEPASPPPAPGPPQPVAAPAPAPPVASPTPPPTISTPTISTPTISTPAISSPPPARPPLLTAPAPAPRPRLLNPRADHRLAAAVSIYGITQGLGLLVEYMPHWVASFGFGIGGTARRIGETTPLAAGTLNAELNLLPLPFVITPILGGGFGFTFGPLAQYLPGIAGRAPDRDQSIRLLPYARFGLRVDLPRRVHLVGEVLLVPDNRLEQGNEIHPLPGLRIGFSVL